jgi:iron complex outermembrane recepter protein
MIRNREISHAVRRALVMSAVAAASASSIPALAQDQEQEEATQTVTVTGTRIQRQDYEATSPLATVSSEAIRATGALNTEAVLNTLPQVVPGFSAASNNPADGTATVDLRGLGPTRTLVLINGKRLNPSVNDGTVDLNNVPTRLIERVEVVTGGASAVYGSDALAGVVNFIIKDDFSGIDIGTQFGQSAESDGTDRQVDLLVGGNFADGNGNMTAFASWYKRDEILQADREYTAVDFAGGSATGVQGRFDNAAANPWLNAAGNFAFNPDGSTTPFINVMPESGNPAGGRYNFAPVNYLLTPAERVNIGAFGHYDFSDNHQVYSELMYVDSKNAQQLAPTPATGILVDPTSPLLSPSAQALLADRADPTAPAIFRRRMLEMGARLQENSSKLQQVNFGFRGDLGFKDLNYDAYYSYGRTEFTNAITNDVSRSRMTAAINGCPADFVRFVPSCVPLNAFGAGNISQEAADFVRLNFTDVLEFERQLVNASINGNLMTMPAGDLGFAIGLEWREDSSDFTPDQNKQRGDILGFNAAQPIQGEFDVKELFAEAIIPLLADAPAAKEFNLELGARLSDYSTVGNVTTYKAGINWAVIDSFRVRGMYQAATRAPSVFELFQAGDQGFPLYTEPCAELVQADDPTTYAFCQAQGITQPENFIQNNAQVEAFFFGNPQLDEESSDTITFGFVAQPEFAEGLQFSIDYWDITVEDYINSLLGGAQGVIDACFASLDLNSSDCQSDLLNAPLIFRDAAGELKVNVPLVNSSELETSGIDFQVDYGIPLSWAGLGEDSKLNMNLLVSYLNEYILDGIDYAGTTGAYNILGSFPEVKANLRLSYGLGPVDLALNTRYIDSMDNQGNIPDFQDPSGYIGAGSIVYMDVSARWQATDAVELSAGVLNIGDKRPPVIDNAIDQNGDPSTWDMVGRFWFGGVRVKF